MSGGVTIPIMFQKIENIPPPQQPKQRQSPVQTKNTVQLSNDLSSSSISTLSSDSISTNNSPSVIQLSPKKENDNVSGSHSSKTSSKKKLLDISDDVKIVKEISAPNSPKKVQRDLVEPLETKETVMPIEEVANEAPKKVAKKKGLPDAKDFQNGDKHTDENNVEYLCIVGKRGGHSWKKISL
jgi:hypothetical protein